ncbi:hypothetical protein ACFX1Q_034515 [Malus domestica]
MEDKEPTRLDSESLPTCQSQSHDGSLGPPHLNQSKEIMGDLELGMEFSSKESAYNYYCNYARDKGFDVRKHHWKKKKTMRLVEGTTYTQPVSRVSCQAHMTCLLKKNGKFNIVSFDAGHNHALVQTPMKHMLKINCKMS